MASNPAPQDGSSFIMGQSSFRTGLSKVGLRKDQGDMTGQFGKTSLMTATNLPVRKFHTQPPSSWQALWPFWRLPLRARKIHFLHGKIVATKFENKVSDSSTSQSTNTRNLRKISKIHFATSSSLPAAGPSNIGYHSEPTELLTP